MTWRVAFFALSISLLSACGFALRGSHILPASLAEIAVSAPSDATERHLLTVLHRSGTKVVDAAPVVLHVYQEDIKRQTSSVDSRAKAAEYTLFYNVSYQLRNAQGEALQTERSIRLRRTYQFDNTRIVGKHEEENTLIDELRQQAMNQMIAQLSRTKL